MTSTDNHSLLKWHCMYFSRHRDEPVCPSERFSLHYSEHLHEKVCMFISVNMETETNHKFLCVGGGNQSTFQICLCSLR